MISIMVNLLIFYILIGFLIYIITNTILWYINSETFTFMETMAVIFFWPTFITSMLNHYYGYSDLDDE